MKTFKLSSLILAIGVSALMSSCLKSGNNSYTITSKIQHMYNAVVDQNNEVTLYPNQGATIEWKYGDNTATFNFTGIKLPNGSSFPTIQIADVPFTVNSRGWMDVTLTDYKPNNGYGNVFFNRFNFQMINRTIQGIELPACVVLNYVVDNEYTVHGLPEELIEIGKTTVIDPDGAVFEQSGSSSIYYLGFDPVKMTGYLIIQGAKFAEGMPGLNMKFPNIPFSVNASGIVTMDAAEIVPSLLAENDNVNSPGTPAPNFPITNFAAVFNAQRGVTLSFNCLAMGKNYRVNFESLYPTSASQQQ